MFALAERELLRQLKEIGRERHGDLTAEGDLPSEVRNDDRACWGVQTRKVTLRIFRRRRRIGVANKDVALRTSKAGG